jgi:hypothetical protein
VPCIGQRLLNGRRIAQVKVVQVGNCSGRDVDKFERFGLTQILAERVAPPLVAECFANLECKVADTQLLGPEYTQAMSPAKRATQSKVVANIRRNCGKKLAGTAKIGVMMYTRMHTEISGQIA